MQQDLQKSNLSEKMLSCTEENDSATASWFSPFTSPLFPTFLKHCPRAMSKIPELSHEDSLKKDNYFTIRFHFPITKIFPSFSVQSALLVSQTQRNGWPMSCFLFCLSCTVVIHQQCNKDCCFLTELTDLVPSNDQWRKFNTAWPKTLRHSSKWKQNVTKEVAFHRCRTFIATCSSCICLYIAFIYNPKKFDYGMKGVLSVFCINVQKSDKQLQRYFEVHYKAIPSRKLLWKNLTQQMP